VEYLPPKEVLLLMPMTKRQQLERDLVSLRGVSGLTDNENSEVSELLARLA
jgi:hypothetical protein